MKNFLNLIIKDKHYKIFDFAVILLVAIIPLFTSFNYRINIFLSWEGAYRMSEGQIPYKDFGLPLGFGYWLVPSMFFKIFGAQFISLIKAQVLLNIISGFSFRQILKNFNVQNGVISLSVFTFCISYSFMNAWPWYNHTVIVYQLLGLAFITYTYSILNNNIKVFIYTFLGSLFLVLSFLTKQDAGFLGIMIAIFVTLGFNFLTKRWIHLIFLILSITFFSLLTISIVDNSFFYWFNYGQLPHSSRISIYDIFNEFFSESQWIRFYLACIILIIIHSIRNYKKKNNNHILFTLFILGILTEATIYQVTSYVPENNNIFFHGFAISFILWYAVEHLSVSINKSVTFLTLFSCLLLFWSPNYWKYINRIASKFKTETVNTSGENVVNKSTYVIDKYLEGAIPASQWVKSDLYTLQKIKMPQSTVDGINRLKNLPELQNPESKKVLNMSELTFLAYEMNFKLEASPEYPLWFHLGVGMFNKQLKMFEHRIKNNYYDVIIYEYLPNLNNFYPLILREQLQRDYLLKDSFLAPRDPSISNIEVYIKK
jgi:hypothetical protein